MAKKVNIRLDRLLRKANVRKAYISDETVFIDASIVRRVKRKALQMQGQLSLHFAGVHYQQCLEELGLWEEPKKMP